ncbi:uncharacterized protein LOC130689698 isoform X2 [Daphnia carinata]|uniref:uncharacterized protein LOC130689698 isoform X2 n=1 Tax=Daphnia carinata TaxID=120202 RepID=UPI00257D148D|nr:uncharacterized protein LOC130689698 isoform X2 [Daphnia carinata]
MDDWYLQRHGHAECRYHLNILLGTREKLTIGRKAGGAVDIVCNGKTVSREHCVLRYVNNCWTIEDLKSLNGVYLNKSRIPANTPTSMPEGCVLGVGAVDISELDYYVFDVLKTTVKNESEGDDAVKIVELPIPAAITGTTTCDPLEESSSKAGSPSEGEPNLLGNSVDRQNNNVVVPSVSGLVGNAQKDSTKCSLEELPRKQLVMSEKPFSSEEVLPAKKLSVVAEKHSTHLDPPPQGEPEKEFQVRNRYGDSEASSAVPNSRHPSLDDVKLKLACKVVIEGLPKHFTISGTNGTWKAHMKKRIKGKRRVLRCISDSDSEGEEILQNGNHLSKIPCAKAELKGKGLKDVVKPEEPKSSLDDYSDEDRAIPSPIPSTSNASSDHSVTKSKFVVEKLSSGLEAEEKVVSDDSGTKRRMSPAPSMLVENVEEFVGDCEILKVGTADLHRAHHYPDSDDDVIILSSGDEETFSSQTRFKLEPIDVPEPSSATHDAAKPLETNENVTSNSLDEEDDRFFPELSQAFLNEIAQEESDEEETNLSRKISERGTDVDKLNSLVKSGRFTPKGKTTLPTEPLTLHNPPRGRFTLATAGTSARRESENQSEPEETDDQRKKSVASNVVTPRIAKIIPIRPQVSRKRKQTNGIASVREKMCKEQGMESYVRCVHEATKKTDDRPSTSSLPIQVPRKKILPSKSRIEVPKAPKSSTANPVKAKVTKKSRGDMFLKDLVGEEQMSKECAKKGSTSALAGFCIPKLSKSTVEPSSNGQEASPSPGTSAQKRKHPDRDEDRLNEAEANVFDESTSVSYAFKKPQKRVARRTSCDGDDRNGGSLSSKFPNRRHDRPRDEALPLGKNKKWGPPNGIKNVRREDVASRLAGNREPTSNSRAPDCQQSNREEAGSPAQHDETIQLPMPDCEKRIRSLSLSALENGNRGILRYHGWNNESKVRKKVSIVEANNKVYEIEARPPTPPLPARTPVRPVDYTALTHDILYRICCWNYNWIAQQKLQQQQKNDEPPPLLAAANRENGQTLPALTLLPVVSAYDSLEAYYTIFQSLMFHETWAILCKDMEGSVPAPIRVLVCSKPKSCNGFAFLRCEALAATRINEKDLVAISVPITPQKPPAKYFGVVDQLVFRNWRKDDTDPRLLESCRRPNETYMRMSFVLLVKLSNVPKELDKIYTITKITRLSTVLKQFILNADLARSPLCDVILHPSDFSDAFKLDTVDIEGKNDLLNSVQHKAVESITKTIVCASDREPKVALLQGPPGTGKSHVIVELISRMLYMHYEKTNKYPRILVCAPSNNAVDEIAARLMRVRDARKSSYHIVRVGVTTSMHPSVAKISLEELTKKRQQKIVDTNQSPESCKLRTLSDERGVLRRKKTTLIASIDAANKNGQSDEARMHARKLEQLESQIEGVDGSLHECRKNHYNYFNSEKMRSQMKKEVILGSQVIFSTLNSCRSRDMENLFVQNRNGPAFLCCIIDEASQCTEPESLTPLVFGISKLVLIGDPDQLPATVTSQYAARHRFDQSLFNRFYSSRSSTNSEEEGVLMLNTQYRMAPSICEWPSKYFYGGKLVTAENLPRTGPCYDYRALNVIDGLEILEDQSYKNEKEALLVAKVVLLILNSPSARGKSVGVITFYRSQQQCIQKKIVEEANHLQCTREIERVEVNTVDSFQGREKDIVIVSCVRAREPRHISGDIGFVSSLQRLNVALTRAKESLVVCGHFQTLQMNETWRDLISNAQGREVAHVVTSDYTSANLSPLVMRPEHKV